MAKNGKNVILGISCFYHDSAAAILVDGIVIAAAQEERFTRKKHDSAFPEFSVKFCLKHAAVDISEVDYIVFYEKPLIKFDRLIQTYFKVWPRGLRQFIAAMKSWLKEKLWIQQIIAKKTGFKGEILFVEHHYAHAASAYYCSDFDDALVITMDGVGEWETATIGHGNGNRLRIDKAINFPNSLGLLYSALTYYLGFKVNSAEYKVMGLAPYGNPDTYAGEFKKLIKINDDGSHWLNSRFFSYEYGLTMTNKKFDRLFGGPPRSPEARLDQRHKDIAAALQKVTEEAVLKIIRYAQSLHPSANLCLAGGVALNCVANGKIIKEKELCREIYIQPAAGDAGGAIGAACYLYYDVLKNPKKKSVMSDAFLGPEFNDDQIGEFLKEKNIKLGHSLHFRLYSYPDLLSKSAALLAENNVVGWFQGRMEFGPRALGNRSILADARNKDNWRRVNLKIKFRESFRPFAPTVLEECASEYFELDGAPSPYMLLVAKVKKNNIPAVTHVDGSARIQTINRAQNPRYYDLLREFYRQTGCPVIINTSFNVRGEPIVCSPENAFNCFVNTDMDYLAMGNYIVSKKENPAIASLRSADDYLTKFTPD